jgi:filamentous hemagglutinin
MQEFLATTSGRQLLGAAADSLDVQLNQIAVALQEGGDANAEQLGTSLGLAASIFVSALAGGQTNVAQAASELSKMGIDLTSNAVKTAAAGYKAKSLETKVAKLQAVGRDLDVPNAPSPVEAPPQPNPTPKGDGFDTLANGAKGPGSKVDDLLPNLNTQVLTETEPRALGGEIKV